MASPAAILQVFVNANTKVASAQLAAFDSQLSSVGKTSAATGAGMGKFTKGAAAAGAGVAAFGVAAAVAGKQLYDLGRDFDQAYDTIRIRTGATGRELERLKGSFKDVAKNVPNDFEDVGKAIGDLNTRLGLTGKPLERMAENMLHLSNLTGDDLEGNIKAVARAFVDWEVTIPKQTKYLNGLFRLSQASGASVSELADSAQRLGSPLRQLGFTFAETAAMFANFERAGVNTQTMMPGLKMAISNLTRPTEELAKTMATLGIQVGKPDIALRQVFKLLSSSSTLTQVQKTGLAMDVFGKRAGADMAEAIRQGRFELDKFLRIFRDNKGDTIGKAADETYDFAENVQILTNRFKIFLEPTANAVVVFLDEFTRKLRNASKEGEGSSKKTTTLGTVLKVLQGILYGVGKVFQMVFRTMVRMIRGVGDVVKHFVGMFKGSFAIVTGILTGNFRKAWNGAKKFTSNAVKTIAALVRTITAPFRSVFQGIYEIVRDKMRGVARVVAGFVNKIISVINLIPGVDLNPLNEGNYFGEGTSQRGPQAAGLQRGGALMGGKPSGDSIPAMLERGEYVLNRKAVQKIGVKRLNAINFKSAPRFQKGGFIDTLTEFPGKFVRPAVDAGTAALGLLMDGPGQFIKMLPKPNLPDPVKGTGPFVIRKAIDFIKRVATSPLKDNEWVDSHTYAVAKFLASKFSASISSSYRSPAENAAVGGVPNSSHTRGTPSNPGAFDFVPPSGGMQSFAGKNIAGITENMIHDVGSGLHNHIAFFQKGGFTGNINKVYPGIQAPDWSGYKLPGYVIAALAQAAGMPGRTMEQMTRGESLGRPGSWGHDANGYSTGYGLWAITDPYANDLAAKVGGYKNFLNPVLNAWAANVIYRRQGLRAWYGDQYVTGGNLDYTGKYDIRKALGGYGYQGALYMASKGRLGEKPKGKAKFGPDKGKDKAEKARETAKKKAKQRRIARKIARMAAKGLQFPGQTRLAEFEAGAEKLVEQIDLYDREATADWSPAGSDYDQTELSSLIAYYTDLLNNYIEQRNIVIAAVKVLQGRIAFWEAKIQATENPGAVMVQNGEIIKPGKKWQIKGWQKAIANARSTIGSLGEKRLALEGLTGDGGAIGDTRFTLKELGATTSPTDTGAADSEIADLLRQQLQETQRALAISQAQMPIFQQFMPRFHRGGIVQGPNGAERPVMAQAGEGIFTRDQMRAMGSQNITVVIEDAAIDSNRIRVEVDGVIQDKVSTVRRQGSNRRFTTSR